VSDAVYVQLLNVACGAVLLAAVLVLWRRRLATLIRLFVLQGVALAAIGAVLAGHERSVALGGVAAGILVLRAGVLPYLAGRWLPDGEVRSAVNVPASLLAAAGLALLAFSISQPLIELAPSPATHAVPVGLAVALIGLLVLATRAGAVAKVIGFLLVDNGITAVALLTTNDVAAIVGLALALDMMVAVLMVAVTVTELREVAE
jgi:hydrogenase-4 component E